MCLNHRHLLLHLGRGQGKSKSFTVSLCMFLNNRTYVYPYRMVLNEASLCTGMMVGNVASGYLYAATNTITVFAISSGLMLLALLYVIVFVVESLRPEQIHSGVS